MNYGAPPLLPRLVDEDSTTAYGMLPKSARTELQLRHQLYAVFILAKITNPDSEKEDADSLWAEVLEGCKTSSFLAPWVTTAWFILP